MLTILLATGNPHKVRELLGVLPVLLPNDTPITYKTLDDLHITLPEETGNTLEENACLKALFAAKQSGLLTLADDTGLEVDYLHGAPGVHTARYAGEPVSTQANNQKLLQALESIPYPQRTARFRTVACIAWPDGKTRIFEGICPGHITTAYHGTNGFGYDPIFMVDEVEKCFAELTAEEKNALSHRGKAFKKVTNFLNTL